MDHAATIGESTPRRQFRRQLHRLVFPCLFVVGMFGYFAYRVPGAIWVAIPAIGIGLLFCLLLHGGLIISSEGIEWYILCPQWRYRMIPWDAVLDVRRAFDFLGPIRLEVKNDRYEMWIWGKPNPDRALTIEIWSNGYSGGETILNTILAFRSSREAVADVGRETQSQT
jgi:hypothetical protein